MDDKNDRIREIAYLLWMEEGCPEGQAERHWRTAEALVEQADIERKEIEGEPPGEEEDSAPIVAPTHPHTPFER